MAKFEVLYVHAAYCLIYGTFRSFIIENTGAAVSRGDATDYDIQKLQSARSIWREPSLRLIGTVSAFSAFLLIPYLFYRDWLILGLVESAVIVAGSFFGRSIYRTNGLNNRILQLISPFFCFGAIYFIVFG